MAITRCRECERDVSTEALACPHCGAPRPTTSRRSGFEWRSEATAFGLPWVHVAWGRDAHGRRRVAKGIVAIGQYAVGVVTVAQFGVGVLFGFGQFVAGVTVVGQFAAGLFVGLGQFTTGEVAVGQIAYGVWVLAQIGFGRHVWSTTREDPAAVAYFRDLGEQIGIL